MDHSLGMNCQEENNKWVEISLKHNFDNISSMHIIYNTHTRAQRGTQLHCSRFSLYLCIYFELCLCCFIEGKNTYINISFHGQWKVWQDSTLTQWLVWLSESRVISVNLSGLVYEHKTLPVFHISRQQKA